MDINKTMNPHDLAEKLLEKYDFDEKNLLQILIEIQKNSERNFIDRKTIEFISKRLNIPETRIDGVISYYDALSFIPKAKYSIGVCKGTSCSIMGNQTLLKWITEILNISKDEITEDGLFSIQQVPCFGACDIAPAIRINDKVYGQLTFEGLNQILTEITRINTLPDTKKPYEKPIGVQVITSNFGKYDGYSIDDYIALGGFKGLINTIAKGAELSIQDISESGLQGRGGAQYPTGRKLSESRRVKNERKVVVCNADEGEPGTFKDRELLRNDPYKVIEGMLIASYVTDATEGFIYLREEYYWMREQIFHAINRCYEKGYLGKNILNSGHCFDLQLVSGAGSYVCGEGFALCESLEGKRGVPRAKPPYVKQAGYLQLPTLIINVETLSAITVIMQNGYQIFTNSGTKLSPGTKVISVSGKVNQPGVFEIPFGYSIKDILYQLAGGIKDGKALNFIQIGGASGGILPASGIDIAYDYETLKSVGQSPGSGAIVVADEEDDIVEYIQTVQDFFSHESCGKCTPCREGNRQLQSILKRFVANEATDEDLSRYKAIVKTLEVASLCGSGKTEAVPLKCAIQYFEESFISRLKR